MKKIMVGVNDLGTTHPTLCLELIKPEKETLTAGMTRIAEWRCHLGHSWSAGVSSRTVRENGCPYCSGHRVLKGFNDLATTHPELSKEAYGWDATEYSAGSGKKLDWICPKNHVWNANIINRVKVNAGCAVCANIKIIPGVNDLLTHFPEIARQAHGWDPKLVGAKSGHKKEWICSLGHIWTDSINHRTLSDRNCPICSGRRVLTGYNDLQTTDPIIAKEADGWDPKKVSRGSNRKLSWKCSLQHTWKTIVANRTIHGKSCPICANKKVLKGFNDLASTHPEIAVQAYKWNPTTVTFGNNSQRQWICNLGHIYKSQVSAKTGKNGTKCPICSGRQVLLGFNDLKTTHPHIANEAYKWDPTTVTFGSEKKRKWMCPEGHVYLMMIGSRTGKNSGCSTCAKYGFDPNIDGYLYFLDHAQWEMFQIGITNFPDVRLKTHIKNGWKLLELRGPMDGYLTRDWETGILRMLKSKNADLSNSEIAGKFDGYTEAWSKKTFPAKSIKELMRLTEEFEEK